MELDMVADMKVDSVLMCWLWVKLVTFRQSKCLKFQNYELAWHEPVVVWCCFNCVDVDLESFHSAWMNPYLVCIQIIWEWNKIVLYELYQILQVTAWWQKQTLFICVHWNWIVLYSVDTLNLVSDVWMEIQWCFFLNQHILVSRFEGLLKINSAISMVLVLVQFEPPSLPSLALLWNSKQFSDIWFHLHLVSKILFFVIEEEFKKEADSKWVAGPDLNEPSICYELTFIGMDKIRSPLLLVLMDAFKG